MDALHRRVAALFPGRSGPRRLRVGVEHEVLTADRQTGAAVTIERVRGATAAAGYACVLGFEPGGQVELSLPCAASPRLCTADLVRVMVELAADCARAGVDVIAEPVDSRGPGEVPLQLTTPRYLAMQEHFDRIGPGGRQMMRRTASTQVCLDWWPGAVGLEQWRLLHLAGPFLAAAFARSVGNGSRLATWLVVDPSRTAFDDRLMRGDDPVAAYADFARHATCFLEPADIDQHLTTLFPPVRPRHRYLEVRFVDVQETAGVAGLLSVLATLTYAEECRRTALRMLERECGRLGERWIASAGADPEVRGLGLELVALAEASTRWAPAGYLPLEVGAALDLRGAA